MDVSTEAKGWFTMKLTATMLNQTFIPLMFAPTLRTGPDDPRCESVLWLAL